MNKKPIGITLIAVYSVLGGILSFLAGSLLLLASSIPDIPLWITLLGIIIVIYSVLLLTAMYGLWSLQTWGINFSRWLYIAAIPLGIISIFPIYPDSEFTVGNLILQLVGIVLAAIIIKYLYSPKIQNLYSV